MTSLLSTTGHRLCASVVALVVLASTFTASPASAGEATFRDQADRTGTIDLREIVLRSTKKKLKVDLTMRHRIKTDLLRDNEAGISMQFEVDDGTNVLRVEYVVDATGAVSLEVCDGFTGCTERKGRIEGKHALFALPLKRVKDGRTVSFSVFTVVFGGANQCPVKAGSCPDSYPNNGSLEEFRVR